MLKMTGAPHIDCGVCMLVENRDFSSEPSVLNYADYDSLTEVTDWITQHDPEIQCVAVPHALASVGIHPRAVALGRTQHPRLTDYPDGRDTMQFLATI